MGCDLPQEKELLYMKKMNMVAKYDAIKAMLNGESVEGFSVADALEFLDGRIELVNKKNANANGERKPTKTQLENEGIKAVILSVMTDKPTTITDLQKHSAELADFSNQKVSSLLTQLVKSGEVVRTEVKGKAHFALATKE